MVKSLVPGAAAALVALAALAVAQEKPASQPTSRPTSQPAASGAKKTGADGFPALGDPAGVYGAGVELATGSALAKAAGMVEKLHGKAIRVDGTIKDVCTKKGCWMVLEDGDTSMRVKFKDYKFFVPRDAHKREVIIQGIISEKQISEEEAKHYAEESGDPDAAKAIKGPQQVLAFMATGAEILGRRELPPAAKPETPEAQKALETKLAAAKPVVALEAAAKSPVQALKLLREAKGPRTVEFSLHAEVGGWYVFSAADGKAFEAGYAVKGGTGEIVRY